MIRFWDIITKVDGKDAGTRDEFMAGMRKRKPGDEVTLTLTRGKDTVEVKAKLAARPKQPQ
jgi:S1-C subfamily serine protease